MSFSNEWLEIKNIKYRLYLEGLRFTNVFSKYVWQ